MNPNEKNDFDRQLKEKFEGFRPEVPGGLWDRIATQLDTKANDTVVEMTPVRRSFPSRWLSVAALLLMGIGIAYWYNRPVAVTYLQGSAQSMAQKPAEPIQTETPDEAPIPDPVPLDVERLRRLFAKKDRKENIEAAATPSRDKESADNASGGNLRVAGTDARVATEVWTATRGSEATKPIPVPTPPHEASPLPEEALARVPDIAPLIPEDEEDALLAAVPDAKPGFGISTILNYVVGAVDQREEKLITFSNDSEGSLKLDFNLGLAKNKKKKLK